MIDDAAVLARLVALEELRSLQGRLCRSAGNRSWDEFERCFATDGQLRVYGTDGALAWFALSPHIGATIDIEVGRDSFVVHAFGEELTLRSETRAEGVWSMEFAIGSDVRGPTRRGYGTLHQTYARDAERWVIRSIDLIQRLGA